MTQSDSAPDASKPDDATKRTDDPNARAPDEAPPPVDTAPPLEVTPVGVPEAQESADTPVAEASTDDTGESADGGDEASVDVTASADDGSDAEGAGGPEAAPGDESTESNEAGGEAPSETDTADAETGKPKAKAKKKARKKKAKRRPPQMRAPEPPPLPPEFRDEAVAAACTRIVTEAGGSAEAVRAALEAVRNGASIPFLGRFRRGLTGGMDERRLRAMRDRFDEVLTLEERRIGIRELLRKRGALTDEATHKLAVAQRVSEMEDLAAPFLPVVASRAIVARGHGLQPLADAIRAATEVAPLSELVKPFVPDDAEPTLLDRALAGARDVLAEELSLDPALRAELRALFHREGMLTVALRPDRKGDAGRHGNLVGFSERALKIPAMKVLSIRRAEKDRVIVTNIEPAEEKALAIVHKRAASADHPHAGFLRAAAEDGYRRILKPVLQNELRLEVKGDADELAMATFERNLRNLLLGPYAGPRRTLGIRPDVTGGHRWCAIDEGGDPVGCGQLPHEPTAGREACLDELRQVLKTYDCRSIAIGMTGGRAEAVSLAREAAPSADVPQDVAEVADGGTRTLESLGPLELDERPPVTAECRGALSLARRFQDPLAELVHVDPKALNLGPGIHDVHQGRLRRMFDDVIRSCVAHAGVNPNTADVELLARVPGFTRGAARALVAWRTEGGHRLTAKAQLAAVDKVGPDVAMEAVGFLRVPEAPDPRDRTQLHPKQYDIAEQIAAQLDVDLPTLFSDPKVRARARLSELVDEYTDIHLLRYVLFQATAGDQDPRPHFAVMIPPPENITIGTLTPGLILQGRVLRAAPFGVFVDVGLGSDALIPTPHIGDRPGLEQAAVAPVGAIVTAKVLEVDLKRKKLTLTMRRDAPPQRGAGPRGRGPQRGRGPRDAGRGPQGAGRGPRGPGRGPQERGRAPQEAGRGPGPQQPGRGGGARDGGRRSSSPRDKVGAGASGRGRGQDRPRRKGRPQKGGKSGGGGFSIFDRRGGRDDRRGGGGPRNISLGPGDPKGPPDAEVIDESKLTEEELMQRKLDEMRRKLEGDRD